MFQNLQALAELAKAGYKPSDIKELLELNKMEPEKAADDSVNVSSEPDSHKETEAEQGEDPLDAIIKRNEGE